MKNNNLEKYISELPPELQEKARQCKDMDELNKLIAENDVELSDDVLEAVAGGGAECPNHHAVGYEMDIPCPDCGHHLYYWDRVAGDGDRYYCNNTDCTGYKEKLLYYNDDGLISVYPR